MFISAKEKTKMKSIDFVLLLTIIVSFLFFFKENRGISFIFGIHLWFLGILLFQICIIKAS